MTRNRISMVVAAAGLILVGLLAAALFSPGNNEPTDEPIAQEDDIQPVEANTQLRVPIPYEIDVPELDVEEIVKKPETTEIKPKPEAKPEPVPKQEGGIIEYTIQRGDMISKIAVRHGCSVNDIYAINDGLDSSNANRIRIGQVIKVPVGKAGSEAVAAASSGSGSGNTTQSSSSSGMVYPERVIAAEAGDTSLSLAVEHYGARHLFRLIVLANPDINWAERLKGGEQVVLPAVGDNSQVQNTEGSAGTPTRVERNSIIPARR
jgi:LysM repeat protein